ncbi:MAG: DUF362 domain-containing protein [Candidatus Heimdallarchaeota archaeon]
MQINREKCTACGRCVPYCPIGAITSDEVSFVDEETCVECGVCLRAQVCKSGAIEPVELSWPRILRSLFSDPLAVHPETDIPGRGTEEMKTNDITHRFKRGQIGLAVELGRPGVGTTFEDVEKVAMALARLNVEFEPKNPVTFLIHPETGRFKDLEVKKERVLSAIIEITSQQVILPNIIDALRSIEKELDTVMTVGLITTCEDGDIPVMSILKEKGNNPRINGKVNLGLALAWSYK